MKSRQTSEKQALTPYSSTDKTLKYCEYVGCIFKSIILHEFLQSLSVTRMAEVTTWLMHFVSDFLYIGIPYPTAPTTGQPLFP